MAWIKSVGVVVLGFLVIVILSTITDTVLEANGVLPKGTLPKSGSEFMLIAILGYRAIYSLIGCYLTARLAPSRPLKHSLALGIMGVVLSTLGAIAMHDKAPIWFNVVLVLMTMPLAWLAGTFVQSRGPKRAK